MPLRIPIFAIVHLSRNSANFSLKGKSISSLWRCRRLMNHWTFRPRVVLILKLRTLCRVFLQWMCLIYCKSNICRDEMYFVRLGQWCMHDGTDRGHFFKYPYSKYVVNQMIVGTHCKCVRPYGNKTDFKCFGFCKRGRIREAPCG